MFRIKIDIRNKEMQRKKFLDLNEHLLTTAAITTTVLASCTPTNKRRYKSLKVINVGDQSKITSSITLLNALKNGPITKVVNSFYKASARLFIFEH